MAKLKTDVKKGINEKNKSDRELFFGTNKKNPPDLKSFG